VKKLIRANHEEEGSKHYIDLSVDQDIEGGERGLLFDGKSEVVGKQNDDTSSSYPLDGRWEMSWKSFPVDTTTFVVHKHNFKIFQYPCEIKLEGPEDNYCPNFSFQWPVAVTSVTNPVFQKSKLAIPPGMKITEWPTRIEWTTTDLQYGVIIWTRANSASSKQSNIRERTRAHHAENDASIKKRLDLEEFRMKSSIPGKAWDLIE
jgi:hypothetical protein